MAIRRGKRKMAPRGTQVTVRTPLSKPRISETKRAKKQNAVLNALHKQRKTLPKRGRMTLEEKQERRDRRKRNY